MNRIYILNGWLSTDELGTIQKVYIRDDFIMESSNILLKPECGSVWYGAFSNPKHLRLFESLVQ